MTVLSSRPSRLASIHPDIQDFVSMVLGMVDAEIGKEGEELMAEEDKSEGVQFLRSLDPGSHLLRLG